MNIHPGVAFQGSLEANTGPIKSKGATNILKLNLV